MEILISYILHVYQVYILVVAVFVYNNKKWSSNLIVPILKIYSLVKLKHFAFMCYLAFTLVYYCLLTLVYLHFLPTKHCANFLTGI